MFKGIFRYLFWKIKPNFKCPDCGTTYRRYYDGHDCICGKINLCGKCWSTTHKDHVAKELVIL